MPDVMIDGVRYVPAPPQGDIARSGLLELVFYASDLDEQVTIRHYLWRVLPASGPARSPTRAARSARGHGGSASTRS